MNEKTVQEWFRDGGDAKFRYTYNLNEDSLVFDGGGFEGMFAENIYNKYKCNIFIFEPIKKYYEEIVMKFKGNKKIKVFNFGLSNINDNVKIYHDGDATTIHKENASFELIDIRDINEFMVENKINNVDLLKLNIEGSEYDVLTKLINEDKLGVVKNIQVQFHSFIDNAIEKRSYIRENLNKTHKETYCYDFVWENWELH